MVPDMLHRGGVIPSENVLVTPPALAVRLALCALVTAATVAGKPALEDPGGTAKLPGMLTFELLLASVTLSPPAGAGELSVTVQAAVPGAVTPAGVQESPLATGG